MTTTTTRRKKTPPPTSSGERVQSNREAKTACDGSYSVRVVPRTMHAARSAAALPVHAHLVPAATRARRFISVLILFSFFCSINLRVVLIELRARKKKNYKMKQAAEHPTTIHVLGWLARRSVPSAFGFAAVGMRRKKKRIAPLPPGYGYLVFK